MVHVLVFLGDKDVKDCEVCRIASSLEEYGRQPVALLDTRDTEGLSALLVAEQDFVQQHGDLLVYPYDNLGRQPTDAEMSVPLHMLKTCGDRGCVYGVPPVRDPCIAVGMPLHEFLIFGCVY